MNVGDARATRSIVRARGTVTRLRSSREAGTDLALAQDVLGRIEQVLASLEMKQRELPEDARRPAYAHEFQTVREFYLDALSALLEPRAVEVFDRAERAAEKLPRALVEVDLKRWATRPASHALLEPSRQDIQAWVRWLRPRLDTLEQTARRLAEARRGGGADVARWEYALQSLTESSELTLEALGHWERALEAYEVLAKGGNVLPAAYASVGRMVARCKEMKAAAMAGQLEVLRERVRHQRDDPDVATFMRGLPLVLSGSHLGVSLGVTLVASIATAGVGGLVSGALGTARVGAGLSFVGSVVVESLTFTTVSRGAQALLPGENVPEPVWTELAWNLGLFSAMRGLGMGVRRMVEGRGWPSLAEASLRQGASFGLLQAYGGLHHRVSSGRWPSEDEWRTMTAHNVILMTGLALGLRVVQGLLPRLGAHSALARFSRTHGARFHALAEVRAQVESSYREAQAKGRLPPGTVESLRSRARRLETELRALVEDVTKAPGFDAEALREEWARTQGLAEEASAELLARLLDISNAQDALKPLGGERQYSYAWGRTNNLENRFRSLGAEVRKSVDATTRLRGMTVRFGGDAPLTLVERPSPYPASREVEVDAKAPEVRKLFEEFGITLPKVQRYVLKEVANELAKNPSAGLPGPVRVIRRRLQLSAESQKKPVQEQLRLERHTGRLRLLADAKLVNVAERLDRNGVLSAHEWLDGRDEGNLRGVVGEWLAVERVLASVPKNTRVLTRVRFRGRFFEDFEMSRPIGSKGGGEVDVASELDILVVAEMNGRFQFSKVANVKVVEPQSVKVFRAEALKQNQMAMTALRAHFEGSPMRIESQSGRAVYGLVSTVSGYDVRTGSDIDLTGRISPTAGPIREDVFLPQSSGSAGSVELLFTYKEIHSITNLLRERQYMRSSGY
ncbi:hypothetical protein [Melittangium boletus]|uniref:hypothetical protein n=1 Tax=Melittangium boletus TaxID=83453 RepID=UPI003DA314C3